MNTRMQKWAEKRAEIEKEADDIKIIIKHDESQKIFDEMLGHPMQELEEILHAFD